MFTFFICSSSVPHPPGWAQPKPVRGIFLLKTSRHPFLVSKSAPPLSTRFPRLLRQPEHSPISRPAPAKVSLSPLQASISYVSCPIAGAAGAFCRSVVVGCLLFSATNTHARTGLYFLSCQPAAAWNKTANHKLPSSRSISSTVQQRKFEKLTRQSPSRRPI